MISQPFLLALLLAATVCAVLYFSKQPSAAGFFKYLPAPLWCYFVPTVLSTLGLIPSNSEIYALMSRFLLPACLLLLLIGTDLPSILRLSPKALLAMAAGSAGIFAGGLGTYILLAPRVSDLWKGWACLSASWTGGSANMIAVREILSAPESLFSNLILVDTVIAYSWMALLVFASKYQDRLNAWFKAEDPSGAAAEADLSPASDIGQRGKLRIGMDYGGLLILAFSSGYALWKVSGHLPPAGAVLNRFTWTVILATALPLLLSLTPARRLDEAGAGSAGNFLLYLLLTSIGARANLRTLTEAPVFILAGFGWVAVHGLFTLIAGRLFRIPASLLAAASQANVGGTVSAPLVAGLYRKNNTAIGLILAVLGNIYGTAFGLAFAEVCRRLG